MTAPFIDLINNTVEQAPSAFNVQTSRMLIFTQKGACSRAQMNFGSISLPAGEKTYLDDEQQFIIADE